MLMHHMVATNGVQKVHIRIQDCFATASNSRLHLLIALGTALCAPSIAGHVFCFCYSFAFSEKAVMKLQMPDGTEQIIGLTGRFLGMRLLFIRHVRSRRGPFIIGP